MKNLFKNTIGFFLCLILVTTQAEAGGVSLGATRVVYLSSINEATLSVYNADKNKEYLIQSWLEKNESKTEDFVITPPLFVIKPDKENILRISYIGQGLPNDRESLFWLSVKAIPSSEKREENQNMLKLAIVSKIKLFYRPENLKVDKNDIIKMVSINAMHDKIQIKNPTPYYVTFVNIVSGGSKINSLMVEPYSEKQEPFAGAKNDDLKYKIINDYGAAINMM